MTIKNDYPLKQLNTFKVEASAKYFVEIKTTQDILDLMQSEIFKENKRLILGGGSNLLFTKNFDGLVIKNSILGIEKISENENEAIYKIGAGEIWDNVVEFAVNNNLGGVENLSAIPGSTGAAPVQNIGAYGTEVKEYVEKVEGINLQTGENKTYNNKECNFEYRNSIFKTADLKNNFLITFVYLRLSKNIKYNLEYKGIKEEIGEKEINLKTIRQAIINIRSSKLPDVTKIGNAGSFFKNPVVSKDKLEELKEQYPDIPSFPYQQDNKWKLSAAWLIEQIGYKGKTFDQKYGVYNNHSLILVNYSEESGEKIYNLAQEIKQKVQEKFGVILEEEVNVI